jgi:hypothetical protein
MSLSQALVVIVIIIIIIIIALALIFPTIYLLIDWRRTCDIIQLHNWCMPIGLCRRERRLSATIRQRNIYFLY